MSLGTPSPSPYALLMLIIVIPNIRVHVGNFVLHAPCVLLQDKRTALMHAAVGGHTDVVLILLSRQDMDMNMRDKVNNIINLHAHRGFIVLAFKTYGVKQE